MIYIGFLIKKCSIMSINAHYWAFKQIIIKPWSFYRIMGRFIIEVNVSCLVSLMLTLTWGVNILFEKLTPEVGVSIWKKKSLAHYASRGVDFMQSLSSFWISLMMTWTLMPLYWALSNLSYYWSESWRRCNLKCVCWCIDGDVGSSFGLGASE